MKKINNDFFEEESTPNAAGKGSDTKAKSKSKKIVLIVVCCILVLAIAAAAFFVVTTKQAEERRKQETVDQILNLDVFHEGVVIDGIDVKGLTKEEAKAYIEAAHSETDGELLYTIVKNDAYDQAKTAADQREAEATAKAEAAAKDAAATAGTDPTVAEAEKEAEAGILLDEEGNPVQAADVAEPADDAQNATALYTVDANGNFAISSECIVASYNIDEVLDEAFNLAKSGTYEELLAEIEDIKTNGREYTTTRTIDITGAKAALEQISEEVHIDPVDATVKFNTEQAGGDNQTDKFTYVDEIMGIDLDVDATYSAMDALAQAGETGDVEMVTKETAPATTVENLKGTITLRGSATTNFSGKRGYAERVWNITKAANMINGMVVQPGETFSMNGAIGVRTKANGWKMAGALSGGQSDVKQYGGGVCQVSTTLYNAVVKGDLEIVYRQAHSEKSSYVDGGLDATINSVGNQIDFKWKNNTNSPIIVVAYTIGYDLYVDIYGEPFATDEYDEIRLSSKHVKDIAPSGEMQYQLVKGKPATYSEVKVKRRTGSVYQSYKNYYKDGKLVKTEELARSTYKAYAGLTLVGQLPGTSPSATPTATAKPGTTTKPTETTKPTVKPTPTPAPAEPVKTPEPVAPAPEPEAPTPGEGE